LNDASSSFDPSISPTGISSLFLFSSFSLFSFLGYFASYSSLLCSSLIKDSYFLSAASFFSNDSFAKLASLASPSAAFSFEDCLGFSGISSSSPVEVAASLLPFDSYSFFAANDSCWSSSSLYINAG